MTATNVSQKIIDRLTSYNSVLGAIGVKNNEIMTTLDKQTKDINASLKTLLLSIHEAFKKLKDTRDVMARAGQPTTEIDTQLSKIITLLDEIEKKNTALGVDALGANIAKTLDEIKAYIDQNALSLSETDPRITKPESRGLFSGLFGSTTPAQTQPTSPAPTATTQRYDSQKVVIDIASNNDLFRKFEKFVNSVQGVNTSGPNIITSQSQYNDFIRNFNDVKRIKNVSRDVELYFENIRASIIKAKTTPLFNQLKSELLSNFPRIEAKYRELNAPQSGGRKHYRKSCKSRKHTKRHTPLHKSKTHRRRRRK